MEERASTLEEELRTAHSTTKKMSAERELHVTKLTQLEETVSRLESYGTAPEQTVAAFTTELQHTQQRLREAEKEIIQLTNKLNAAGVRVRTSQSDKDGNARAALVSDVAVRNADTDLGTQLASALVALERLAEEREAALEKATEMEERVSTLEEELRTAHSTTKKMSAERELHVTKLTQLEETVSRLESYGTAPEQTVAAFTAELQHTQQRLREAEEEIIQLTNKLNAAGVRVRTSQSDKDGNARAALVSDVAVRNADTDLGTQLASALVALERLAEEREAALEKATEMEERVSTLEEELRTTKEKLETSVEEISFLKDEVLVSNRLIVDSVSSLNGKVGDSDGAVGADVERLSRVVDELHAQVSATKRGFEEFYDRRSEGCVTELIVARRSVDRSNDARRRLEERNVRLEQDLERKCLEVVKLQKECQRLEQFVRVKDVRGAQSVLGVDSSVDVSSVGVEPVDLEAVDLAQFLQISSLHADLMLCRKTCRQLESNQEELLLSLEQNSSQSNAYLEDLDEIRQQLVEMRQQREELMAERRTLTERVDELGRERGEEVSRLKQQNNSLSVQLQASRNKLSALEASKREGELAARQQAEELAKAFSLMEAQVQTLREEVASTSGSPKRQSGSSRQKAVVEGDEARIRMSQARVTFLEKALQRKDEEVQRLQDELVQKDEQLDQYEQDAAKAAQDAENASRKTLQLESAVQKLQGDKKGLEDELRYAKTRVVTYGGRVSSEVAQHSSPPEQQIRGSPVLGAGRTTRERVSLSVESSHRSRITEQTQRQVRQVMDIRSTRKRSRSANAVS
ncbi:NUP-1 protein [Trypanosoma brucei equiperdum]|uniref:NUP-1 protein n=1 Tax=Trypanosoma brucei equiperdum TaxID=630700 RepID=A0A3L6LBP4_9TRYP|nr:NUP-1 protein [Trypanosoma brucei equiperdum]